MENNNQSSVKTKNITLSSVIGWVLGVIFAISGITYLGSNFFLGILFLLIAVVLIPPVIKKIQQKLNIKLSRSVKILVLLILFVIAMSSMPEKEGVKETSSSSNTSENTPSPEQVKKDREITSLVFAKDVIKKILKAPSTAKFVDVQAYELSNEKDVWAVNGYVDSQNSFGAMMRSQWEVQLDYRDGKGGTIKSILFDGKKIQ